MLTSFFGKSAPINYVLLSAAIAIASILSFFLGTRSEILDMAEMAVSIGLLIFALLLLDFVIRKNNLNGNNNYGIFIYTAFVIMLPETIQKPEIVLTSVFLLLAQRRIFSLSSQRNIEKKILDASLWIALATFFSFYSALLLLLLYYAIVYRTGARLTLLAIPIIGFLGAALITTAFWLVAYDSFEWHTNIRLVPDLNFSSYLNVKLLIPVVLSVLLGALAIITALFRAKMINRKRRPYYLLLPIGTALLIVIAATMSLKDGSELIVAIPILSAAAGTLVQDPPAKLLGEAILWILLLSPIVVWFL